MAGENIVWVSASMEADTKARLDQMAIEDERSYSGLIRFLINREWERRRPVSTETDEQLAVRLESLATATAAGAA